MISKAHRKSNLFLQVLNIFEKSEKYYMNSSLKYPFEYDIMTKNKE